MLMLSTTLLRNTGTCPQLGCIRVDLKQVSENYHEQMFSELVSRQIYSRVGHQILT